MSTVEDRRAKLEAWRRKRGLLADSGAENNANVNVEVFDNKKRKMPEMEAPIDPVKAQRSAEAATAFAEKNAKRTRRSQWGIKNDVNAQQSLVNVLRGVQAPTAVEEEAALPAAAEEEQPPVPVEPPTATVMPPPPAVSAHTTPASTPSAHLARLSIRSMKKSALKKTTPLSAASSGRRRTGATPLRRRPASRLASARATPAAAVPGSVFATPQLPESAVAAAAARGTRSSARLSAAKARAAISRHYTTSATSSAVQTPQPHVSLTPLAPLTPMSSAGAAFLESVEVSPQLPAPGTLSAPELEALLAEKEGELRLLRERHAALVALKTAEGVLGGNGLTGDAAQLVAEAEAARDEQHAAATRLQAEVHELRAQLADAEHAAADARLRAEVAMRREVEAAAARDAALRSGELAEAAAAALRKEAEAAAAECAALREAAARDYAERRRLHNELQELKGNIRVYCRVRPANDAERAAKSRQVYRMLYEGDDRLTVCQRASSRVGGTNAVVSQHAFQYNRIFGEGASQQDVFSELGELVQSALDGHSVCVFAYGQTGAGKTYTMEGPNVDDGDQWSRGVIPRAVDKVFEYAEQQALRGWEYSFECHFLEIYLDDIYDLLQTTCGSSRSAARVPLRVTQRRDGGVDVQGLTREPVTAPETVYALLQRAAAVRATGSTAMNERSSRSHSVFALHVRGRNEAGGEQIDGVLHLVDLAGSERVARSGATGDQLREAQAINGSLTALGNVIRAVADKRPHVPYRDSKLTRLLEPYLGHSSKMLMFVNVSPEAEDAQETLSSLRFAEKVNACEIGRAVRNVQRS